MIGDIKAMRTGLIQRLALLSIVLAFSSGALGVREVDKGFCKWYEPIGILGPTRRPFLLILDTDSPTVLIAFIEIGTS